MPRSPIETSLNLITRALIPRRIFYLRPACFFDLDLRLGLLGFTL